METERQISPAHSSHQSQRISDGTMRNRTQAEPDGGPAGLPGRWGEVIAVEANRCSGHVIPDSGHVAHGPCESSRSGAAFVKMADLVVSVMTEVGARPRRPGSDLVPLCPSAALISENQKFDC